MRIVAMGRLVDQKDFHTLIRAFNELAEDLPRTMLDIYGEGPQRAALEKLIDDSRYSGRIHLMGYTPNPLKALSEADLFVLSSKHEGFGNVIVEALGCGVPVVSTDCPHGPAEILENGTFGSLVPVGDPIGLAEAIRSELARRRDPALLWLRSRQFSVEAGAAAYKQLFKAVEEE
jgi:glycosyltransferase involved in cell wall biosynthesis